jgi:hypothetical protein
MSGFLVPKLTLRNTKKLEKEIVDDYLLSSNEDDVLDYNNRTKAIEYTDKTNDLEYNGFTFLSTIFNDNYYYIMKILNNNNSGIASILYAISPEFSLIENDRFKFVDEFIKHLVVEIDERGLFKKLHCGKNHLKKKPLLKILLQTKKYDSYEVFKYMCIRFSIGLVILEEGTFQVIHEIPDRKCVILIKRDSQYWLLCDKNNESYLFTIGDSRKWINSLKGNMFKLLDINTYKVGDLRDIAKKHNIKISDCGKKDEIYDRIKKWIN